MTDHTDIFFVRVVFSWHEDDLNSLNNLDTTQGAETKVEEDTIKDGNRNFSQERSYEVSQT